MSQVEIFFRNLIAIKALALHLSSLIQAVNGRNLI